MSDAVWKTKDGRAIPIANLDDQHLVAAWAMLKRSGFVTPAEIAAYIFGPRPTGDMAQLAFDDEFSQILERPVSAKMEALWKEIERRGLVDNAENRSKL